MLGEHGVMIVGYTSLDDRPTPLGRRCHLDLDTVRPDADVETGIGKWSFSAFQRAMREGSKQNPLNSDRRRQGQHGAGLRVHGARHAATPTAVPV
jgi:hypothetical protein